MAEGRRRLSTTIFIALVASALACVVAAFLGTAAVYYAAHENGEAQRLSSVAQKASDALGPLDEAGRKAMLDAQLPGPERYTLVSGDGAVLFDSAGAEENHGNRPEVLEAEKAGTAAVSRHSATLGRDMLYVARRLPGGDVLRVSEERESFVAFAGSFVAPAAVVMAAVAGFAAVGSRIITKRIVAPFAALDDARVAPGCYREVAPLLQRIHEQQDLLREQNAELARADTLRRDFSANVSHEMKTPLQIISGYAEIIDQGIADEADTHAFAHIIYDEARRMRRLIDDVLTLSRMDEPLGTEHEPVDLLELAGSVVRRMGPVAEAAEVGLRALGSPLVAEANARLLDQALSNLVENAVRYSPAGSQVTVSVAKDCHAAAAGAGAEAAASERDEGCGLAPEEQAKVFERFYRVDKSRSKETGGTGLGLAIVKHAVEQCGGTVELDSEPGRGSVFRLRLPLA